MTGRRGEIPAAPITAFVVAEVTSGRTTWSDLCRRIGWVESNGYGQTSRLQRRLGLRPTKQRNGRNQTYETLRYETALAITEALGRDPVDFGL